MSQKAIDAAFNAKMGSPARLVVAVYLGMRAEDDGGVPWLTYDEIAKATHSNMATLLAAVDMLQELGLLTAEFADDRARFQWNLAKIGGAL